MNLAVYLVLLERTHCEEPEPSLLFQLIKLLNLFNKGWNLIALPVQHGLGVSVCELAVFPIPGRVHYLWYNSLYITTLLTHAFKVCIASFV